jgi:beta-hydroxylase
MATCRVYFFVLDFVMNADDIFGGSRVAAWAFRLCEGAIRHGTAQGRQTFFDPTRFDWVAELETHWQTIRRELDGVLTHRVHLPGFHHVVSERTSWAITRDLDWQVFMFYGYGHRVEENCQKCPETATLIGRVPGLKAAFFSILAPGKHIPPHRGPYNGVLRYHLGLMMPHNQTACRIRVGNEFAHWTEGKSLIFDDSHEHEVWNETDDVRVVLFMDVVRPLPFPISMLNRAFLKWVESSDFVKQAHHRTTAWDKLPHIGDRWREDWLGMSVDGMMVGDVWVVVIDPSFPQLDKVLKVLNSVHRWVGFPCVVGAVPAHHLDAFCKTHAVSFPIAPLTHPFLAVFDCDHPVVWVLKDGYISDRWFDGFPPQVMDQIKQRLRLPF